MSAGVVSETEHNAGSQLEVVSPKVCRACVETDASVPQVESQSDALRRVILHDTTGIQREVDSTPEAKVKRRSRCNRRNSAAIRLESRTNLGKQTESVNPLTTFYPEE